MGRLKLILMKSVLPKVVYSFNINSKSQQDFCIYIHKIILKFILKITVYIKSFERGKTILKRGIKWKISVYLISR